VSGIPQVNPWGQLWVDQSRGLEPEEPVTQSKGNVINIGGGEYGANTGALPFAIGGFQYVNPIWPSEEEEMAGPTREELDAKQATAAAETDVKFAQLIGEIRLISTDLKGEMKNINTRLDGVEKSTSGVKGIIVLAALGTIAVIVGILTFGQQWFGVGVTTRDIIRATVAEERIQHPQLPVQIPAPPPNTHQ
jgi:hypothetical protein